MSIQDIVRRAVLALGFEEGVGTRVFDSSPKKNNGTLGAGAATPTWVTGKDGFGNALSFDGGDHVEVPHDPSIAFTSEPFAVIYWTNPTYVYNKPVICKGRQFNDGWYVNQLVANGITFHTQQLGARIQQVTSSYANVIPNGVYSHVMIVRDGALVTIYINGIDRTAVHGTHIDPAPSVRSLFIGSYDAGAIPMTGILDDVIILPYAPTPIEVRALYESRSAFTATPNLRKGLVLDLDLQEGAGLKAFDRSWYSKNGTITGADWVAGQKGRALDFVSANNDKLDCGNVSASVRAIVFWINLDTTTEDILELNANDRIIVTAGVLSAVSFEGTTVFYVNAMLGTGISASEWAHVVVTSDANENASALVVAFVNAAYNDFKMENLKIFNRVPSPTEIRALYEEGR